MTIILVNNLNFLQRFLQHFDYKLLTGLHVTLIKLAVLSLTVDIINRVFNMWHVSDATHSGEKKKKDSEKLCS